MLFLSKDHLLNFCVEHILIMLRTSSTIFPRPFQVLSNSDFEKLFTPTILWQQSRFSKYNFFILKPQNFRSGVIQNLPVLGTNLVEIIPQFKLFPIKCNIFLKKILWYRTNSQSFSWQVYSKKVDLLPILDVVTNHLNILFILNGNVKFHTMRFCFLSV